MNVELPIRTPTSVVFFIAAAVAAWYSPDKDFIRWFAYSAFCWFLVLGPIRWIEHGILSLPWKVQYNKWGILDELPGMAWLSWTSLVLQIAVLVLGFVFALLGVLRV